MLQTPRKSLKIKKKLSIINMLKEERKVNHINCSQEKRESKNRVEDKVLEKGKNKDKNRKH